MTAEQLMDSIKVRSELEAFASAWAKRKTSEQEKLVRLEALLGVLGAVPLMTKPSPVITHNARPPMPESVGRDFTPEEAAEARAEDAANKPEDIRVTMDWAYDMFCKGKRTQQSGVSIITLPIQDRATGKHVPMEGWEEYFKSKGISVSGLETRIDAPNNRFQLLWA